MREESEAVETVSRMAVGTAGSIARRRRSRWREDRDPRLPDDPPPPTLAKASISKIEKKNNKKVKKTSPFFTHRVFCMLFLLAVR